MKPYKALIKLIPTASVRFLYSYSLLPPQLLFISSHLSADLIFQGLWFGFKGVGFGGGGLGVTLYLPVTQSITIAGPGSPVSLSQ